MSGYKNRIRDLLVNENPKLDVRIDQCDTIRVMHGKLFAGINKTESGFITEISSMDEAGIFGANVLGDYVGETEEEIVKIVLTKLSEAS